MRPRAPGNPQGPAGHAAEGTAEGPIRDEAILRALLEADPGFLAPLDLAGRAGLAPAELDARLDALRKRGFAFERHPALGIRLVEIPENLTSEEIGARLTPERRLGEPIHVLAETSSSNDVAARMAARGAREGTVVFAESQTAGRGRLGRPWISPAGKGLWFTLLLRPRLSPAAAPRITVMAGVAVARALRQTTRLPIRIKWPNDLLCRERKLAGILTEVKIEGARLAYALVGVGVNVNLDRDDFPDALRDVASSLQREGGCAFPRAPLAAAILREIEAECGRLDDARFPALADEWIALDDTLGKQVRLRGPDGLRFGQATGLDPDGALLLRLDDGRIERVLGGDVSVERA